MDHVAVGFFWAVLGAACTVVILNLLRKAKLKRKIRKAKKSEIRAAKLLEKQGFEVIDLQKEVSYILLVDGRPYKASVKADFIVKKGNKIYVAEVKTGEKAPSPRFPATRRQLLEYYMVYRPDGLLLVDMENEEIKKVEYSILEKKTLISLHRFVWYAGILLLGFIVGFLTRGD
ncbi:hypothetical protein [Thermoanaerobacterium sp. DL9XJH110]|jgi:hypothetical protein|uniref:hypothetical protein n=1 Tax=Thermoanaerobacterium sp. DL9XJH110 TaxID=3386643 RepID=UPI003BB64025